MGALAGLLCLLCLLCGCASGPEGAVGRSVGLDLPRPVQTTYSDSHGGFHGDGLLLVALTFVPEDGAEVEEQIRGRGDRWSEGPFDAGLAGLLYRGGPAEEGEWPRSPERGWWLFQDRQKTGGGPLDTRGSFNYTAALYDGDTCTLYYLEFDT